MYMPAALAILQRQHEKRAGGDEKDRLDENESAGRQNRTEQDADPERQNEDGDDRRKLFHHTDHRSRKNAGLSKGFCAVYPMRKRRKVCRGF